MSKSYRIRTTPGIDKNIKINIEQDFDSIDVLSLKLTQVGDYSPLCADFGVVIGRVFTNGGYGIPNARVSIFVPIEDLDEDDPVINELYPYRTVTQKNDDGYRYNLLPSVQQHSGHTPTGTFPSKADVLSKEHVLEVYDKYYKYTAKTNDSGDFMLFGVPIGTHIIHYDLDLSDIGCQSLVPYDFIYEGVSEQKFENSYTFMASDNLDSLPQIVSSQKSVNVEPFWGNPDLCQIGITRSDFDLAENGVRIEPYSIIMGGTYTDTGRDAVRVRCNVDNQMGEKCGLTTVEGDVEAIRFSGEYETNPTTGEIDLRRPILESIALDSRIDETGSFFVRIPMNMKYITTDEFGYIVESKDPDVGIPTEGRYRFRFSLSEDSGAKKTFRGKYLVPQIKEHAVINDNGGYAGINPKSYSFSTNIDDYPPEAIDDIVGINNEHGYPNDYFYGLRYSRVYTVSGFINKYYNTGFFERVFSIFTSDRNESFIGIKEIQPSAEDDCPNTNEYFPIVDAVSNFKFKFLITIFFNFFERIALSFVVLVAGFVVNLIYFIADLIWIYISLGFLGSISLFKSQARAIRDLARSLQGTLTLRLGLVNYPDCYNCKNASGEVDVPSTPDPVDIPDDQTIINEATQNTPIYTNVDMTEYYSSTSNTGGTVNYDNNLYIPNGVSLDTNGIYVLRFDLGTGSTYDIVVNGINNTGSVSYIGSTFTTIKDKIFNANYISAQNEPDGYDTLVSGSAHSIDGTVTISKIYLYGIFENQTSSNNTTIETGCEKYDVIYDEYAGTGDPRNMELRAFVTPTYSDYDSLPDIPAELPGIVFPRDDIFITQDPCNSTIPDTNVIVSFSRVARRHQLSDSRGKFRRRLFYNEGGTKSSYSEFRDGVFTLLPALGNNVALVGEYARRKLIGQLMCQGFTSYAFFNNWLNGSLYFFQFRKRRGGEDAKYCKDLLYRKEDETGVHYYYRSTPYYNGNFIGLRKSYSAGDSDIRDDREILQPTTIADLGPRNTFINEICTDSSLDVNCSVTRSIGSTSYQNINDLMEFVLTSKEGKERGKLTISKLFDDRGRGQIDGDIAQLLNMNSQAGIYGFEYESQDSPYLEYQNFYDASGPVGIDFIFSEDDIDTPDIIEMNGALIRLCMNGVGRLSETAQEVPFYMWNKGGTGFGYDSGVLESIGTNPDNYIINNSEIQTFNKDAIYSTNYQGGWITGKKYDGTSTTFTVTLNSDPDPNDEDGVYYFDGEKYTLPPIRDCEDLNYTQTEHPLGGPFFFYFGLRTGQTAWNKFVKNYGPK